ncbi:hypothetical protein GOODEAATRI_010560 [Goodea atripinnis]|uniref:THUMP domain-containing protein n=1 Tax=Goodea atripinnis TaxID=208336 RepID=A0ABV0NTJ8_9TELE
MSAVQNETRKRSKKRYVSGQQGKRWKGSRELEVGMLGILITCNMNERKCTAEAFNLLNEYADKLFGPEKVTGTCKAFQEDMLKYLTTFLEPWFKTPNSATYQIAFKARNSSHNKREEIIKSIAGLVGKLNPKNKVDLTNPELTIIVEVIKAVCCVSVAKDYTLYRKYNVQEVVKEDAPKPDAAKMKTNPNAAEQEDEHNGGEAEKKEEKKVAEDEKTEAQNEEKVDKGEDDGE